MNAEAKTKVESDAYSLTIASFNLLAPCYKRTKQGRERSNAEVWKQRQKRCIDMVRKLDSHILGVQEYWFNPHFQSMYESKSGLEPSYDYYGVRRPYKEDGLALFTRRNLIEVVDSHPVVYGFHGQRCGLIQTLKTKTKKPVDLVVVNTHLTFPHSISDDQLRLKQVKRLLEELDSYLLKRRLKSTAPTFVMGDFNGGVDAVYRMFVKQGFKSSYGEANGREAAVTHFSHRKEEVGVDFIWYRPAWKGGVVVNHSSLIPAGVTDKRWPVDFDLSDHRPVVSRFQLRARMDDGGDNLVPSTRTMNKPKGEEKAGRVAGSRFSEIDDSSPDKRGGVQAHHKK